jgi:hypothetical protein
VTRADIEAFKTGVVTGQSARDQKLGERRRLIVKGGKGALARTLGLLGAIFRLGPRQWLCRIIAAQDPIFFPRRPPKEGVIKFCRI